MSTSEVKSQRYAFKSECDLVLERYARRDPARETALYTLLNPVWRCYFYERHREALDFIGSAKVGPVEHLRVLDVGCGDGADLLMLLAAGFRAENLVGIDLRREMIARARSRLPGAARVCVGDAESLPIEAGSFDVVMQWTVFTSLLDDCFQERLAARMWSWLSPGGAVLWYDFVYNNPNNRDVRGVPLRRVFKLFPEGKFKVKRVTLAPPIARLAVRIHPSLYGFLNALAFLRTHILCWIEKTAVPNQLGKMAGAAEARNY
jgi:SAM-dependent methyltransferase